MLPLKKLVVTDLKGRLKELQAKLRQLKKDIRAASATGKRKKFEFVIVIQSYRDSEEERPVIYRGRATLEQAMREAIKEFKEKNKCSNFEAMYWVSVRMPNRNEVAIPKQYYEKYHEKYGRPPVKS